MSRLALEAQQPQARRFYAEQDEAPPTMDRPGWFRDREHGGWGWSRQGSEAVVGVYRRPNGPDLPAADLPHGAGAAAGVSVSVKLGGGGA